MPYLLNRTYPIRNKYIWTSLKQKWIQIFVCKWFCCPHNSENDHCHYWLMLMLFQPFLLYTTKVVAELEQKSKFSMYNNINLCPSFTQSYYRASEVTWATLRVFLSFLELDNIFFQFRWIKKRDILLNNFWWILDILLIEVTLVWRNMRF